MHLFHHTSLFIKCLDGNCRRNFGLEKTGKPDTGWSVIVNSKTRPKGKASIFKIPHHGSETAHHQDVWNDMLYNEPIAVLTPNNRGRAILPKKEDVDRICNLTNEAYSTATLKRKKASKRDKTVEKTIKGVVRYIKSVHDSIGHVRLRCKITIKPINWKVELFNDAVPLKNLYN